jgi:hypothetical protein
MPLVPALETGRWVEMTYRLSALVIQMSGFCPV